MKLLVRNIIVLFISILIGMIICMGIIIMGWKIFPFPQNINPIIDIMPFKYFIFPFLAHLTGTFCSSFFGSKFSKGHSFTIAILIGIFFLMLGIYGILILPTPLWFIIIDITICYMPMAYLGWFINNDRK